MIKRMPCGHKPRIRSITWGGETTYYIACEAQNMVGSQCWAGPERKTERGAINAWNRVVDQLRQVKP